MFEVEFLEALVDTYRSRYPKLRKLNLQGSNTDDN